MDPPSHEATAQQSCLEKKKKMSLLPMGECNDPNYGLSDEAVPAPGRPQQQAWLTEQVGRETWPWAARGRWTLAQDDSCRLALSHSEAVKSPGLLLEEALGHCGWEREGQEEYAGYTLDKVAWPVHLLHQNGYRLHYY